MKLNPNQTQYQYMLDANKNNMDGIAIKTHNRIITYEELHESIDKMAKMLYKKGVRPGDKIGLCTMNTPEGIFIYYAII